MAEINRFIRYQEDFLNCTRIISRSMRLLESANGNVDTIISYCVDIESEISESEGYLKAMDIETKSMVSAIDKKNSQQKVIDYKDEMKQIYKRYETAKFNAESLALKSNPGSRTKLLTANQRLDESTRSLEQSRMIIGQTESIGNTIMNDLESQREILVGAQGKVQETRQYTLEAKGILKMMGNRAFYHKCSVIFTIIILAIAIGLIAYYGFIHNSSSSSS